MRALLDINVLWALRGDPTAGRPAPCTVRGLCVILDPTPEELGTARTGDLWDLWNSKRAKDLFSVV